MIQQINNFKNMESDEKNRVYKTIIMICLFLVLLLTMISLSISYPDEQEPVSTASGAQSGAEEILAALRNESEDALSSALSYTMTHYSTTPGEKQTELMNRSFMEQFYETLKEKAGLKVNAPEEVSPLHRADEVYRTEVTLDTSGETSGSTASSYRTFTEYLSSLASDESISISSAKNERIYIAYSKNKYYVEIQNVRIRSGDGSELVTSLRFTPPDSIGTASSASYSGEVNQYAAVADGQVISTGGTNRIHGSVYAGRNIGSQISGTLQILDGRVVAKESLTASGSSLLDIEEGEVWTESIVTSRSEGSSVASRQGNGITIDGNCYVAGDLQLQNPGFDVVIDGNYYGYGMDGQDTESSGEGSSGTQDRLLSTLFNGSYRSSTTENGTTSYSATTGGSSGVSGSTITINAAAAQARVASRAGQILWLAGSNFFSVAPAEGREAMTSATLPLAVTGSSTGDDSSATNLYALYSSEFNGLLSALEKNASSTRPSYNLAEHLMETNELSMTNVIYTPEADGTMTPHNLEVLSDAYGGHISISSRSEYKTGILIADCDVNVANTTFTGLILTTGDVRLTGGAVLQSGGEVVRFTAVHAASADSSENTDGRVQAELYDTK